MYSNDAITNSILKSFALRGLMMRYSQFAPRLYNFCLSLGFTAGKIMPSRAFCSDESQGFPTILIAKHFGAFPFNHGRVGGIVATDRHGPHAHHGKDMLIVQASHVGYDPDTQKFGEYRRHQTEGARKSTNCGKIMATLAWYQSEFELASNNIFLETDGDKFYITIDKALLRTDKNEGLFLRLDKIIGKNQEPLHSYSTSSQFSVSDDFLNMLGRDTWQPKQRVALQNNLRPELYYFERNVAHDTEGHSHLGHNLLPAMPWILASDYPALTAAKVNTQVEFDRSYRTILVEPDYQGKNLLFISGLHIDISPAESQPFPLTKFVPWAAYHQHENGEHQIIEQAELNTLLRAQSVKNPAKLDLEAAIQSMEAAEEILIEVD